VDYTSDHNLDINDHFKFPKITLDIIFDSSIMVVEKIGGIMPLSIKDFMPLVKGQEYTIRPIIPLGNKRYNKITAKDLIGAKNILKTHSTKWTKYPGGTIFAPELDEEYKEDNPETSEDIREREAEVEKQRKFLETHEDILRKRAEQLAEKEKELKAKEKELADNIQKIEEEKKRLEELAKQLQKKEEVLGKEEFKKTEAYEIMG